MIGCGTDKEEAGQTLGQLYETGAVEADFIGGLFSLASKQLYVGIICHTCIMADISKIITVTEIKTLRSAKKKNYADFVKQECTVTGLPLVCWNLLGLPQTNNEKSAPRNVGDVSAEIRTKFQNTRRKCHNISLLICSLLITRWEIFTGRKISGLIYSLLWDFTRHRLVVFFCRNFGTTHLQRSSCLTLEDGTYNMSRNVGNKQPIYSDVQRTVHLDICL